MSGPQKDLQTKTGQRPAGGTPDSGARRGSLLARFRARARYLLDRAFDREFPAQMGLFVLLVLVVTIIGTTVVFFGLFSPRNEAVTAIPRDVDRGVLDALWWSMNHVLALPKFERMYGASPIVLLYSFLLSLIGIAIFGTLISLINNYMRNRVDALRRGDTPVLERGHVLVLGWSGVTIAVLRQLAELSPGSRVVVLAPLDIDDMRERLRVAGIPLLDLTVILRSGVTSNRRELERVAVHQAESIIVLATTADDSEAIKTLVQLASLADLAQRQAPVTAEIREETSGDIAQIASRNRAHVVTSSSLISRVIVQTIRNPGLSSVLSELGSMTGNTIAVQFVPSAVGKTIEEIFHHFPSAVPLGVSWRKEEGEQTSQAVALNPEPDFDLADEDRLVFITRSRPVVYEAQPYAPAAPASEAPPRVPRVPERILLIGDSSLLPDVLAQIETHSVRGTGITLLSARPRDEVEAAIASQTFDNIRIEVAEGDPASASAYGQLPLEDYDCIVILASDALDTDPDTQTLRVALRLMDLRSDQERHAHLVVEITDEANRDMFRDLAVQDIVVSTDIISMSLAQVAQEPILGPIYRELLNAGGVEISLRPLHDYLPIGNHYRFDDLLHAAQQKLEVALGVSAAAEGTIDLNPDRTTLRQVEADDRIVVLAQQIYQ